MIAEILVVVCREAIRTHSNAVLLCGLINALVDAGVDAEDADWWCGLGMLYAAVRELVGR